MNRRGFLGVGWKVTAFVSLLSLGLKSNSNGYVNVRLKVAANREGEAVDMSVRMPKGSTVFDVTTESVPTMITPSYQGRLLPVVNEVESPFFWINGQPVYEGTPDSIVLKDGDLVSWTWPNS